MKKFFARACVIACAMFALSAQAVDLPQSLKVTTPSGTQLAITLHRTASFECLAGQVVTTRVDSDLKYYVDPAGAVCANFKTVPNFATNWVQQPGTQRWFQVIYDSAQCYSGQTVLSYSYGLALNDGCQLHSVLKQMSKQ